ncbi:unnamed protein product, partial [Closterium sp. Yama58-4]
MEIQLAAAAVRALEAALKRKLEGEAVGDFNVDAAAEASALLKRARVNPEGGAATQSGRPEAGAAGRADGSSDRGDANNADANRAESSRRPAAGGSRPAARGGADDVMPTRSELEAIWQLVHSGYFAGGGEGELREGQGAHEAADLAGASGSRGDGSLPRAVGTAEVAAREGRAIRKAWEESLSAQGGGAGGGVGERGGKADEFLGGGGQQSSKKGQNLGPQAMAARMRRERVNARMRVLQGLVPGAATMTTESFLLEAVHYVRFLLQQVMELSELYTPQNRNREEGEGESGEAGEGAGCSAEGGPGGKGDVDSELRREGLRLVRVDRLLPIVGPALFPPSFAVAISPLMAAVAASLASVASCAVSSARSAESKPLVHVSPINRLRVSYAISRSQSQSRRTSLTVRASGESSDTPATDSPAAAAAASAGSKPTPEAASAESTSASGVPVLTIVAGFFRATNLVVTLTSLLVFLIIRISPGDARLMTKDDRKRRTRDGDDGESDGEEDGKGRRGEEGGRERKERKEKERKGGRREKGERRRKRREKKRRSVSDDDASSSDWSGSSRNSSGSESKSSSDADSDSSSDDRKKKRRREKREKRGKEKEKRRRKEGGRENEQDGGSAEDRLERDLRRMMREFPLDVSHDLVRLLERVDGGEAVDVGGVPDRRLKKLLGSIFRSLGIDSQGKSKGKGGKSKRASSSSRASLYHLPSAAPRCLPRVVPLVANLLQNLPDPDAAAVGAGGAGAENGGGGGKGEERGEGKEGGSDLAEGGLGRGGDEAAVPPSFCTEGYAPPSARATSSPPAHAPPPPSSRSIPNSPQTPPPQPPSLSQYPPTTMGQAMLAAVQMVLTCFPPNTPPPSISPRFSLPLQQHRPCHDHSSAGSSDTFPRCIGPAMPTAAQLAAAASLTRAVEEMKEAEQALQDSPFVGPMPPALAAEAANATQAEKYEEVERILDPELTAYAILGVTPAAGDGEIKKRYWKASLLVHPDKCSHPRAQEAFLRLNDAVNRLKDPTKRSVVDAEIAAREERKAMEVELRALREAAEWRKLR